MSTNTIIPLVDMSAEYAEHGQEISMAMSDVTKAGNFILGPQVATLESKLSEYVQGEKKDEQIHCIGVSDGTAALQLCLMALGIGQGDEVITVPFTWISTAEIIPLVGASSVFVDVEKDTFLMDIDKVSALITPATRAVITVSLFGLIPNLQRLRTVLDEAEQKFGTKIAIIEDGAQSFGAVREGYRSCSSPYITCGTTSFFPTKPLSCYGDGGAVFTRDDALANTITALRVHGKMNGKHHIIGLNARLDTIQAAVILKKLTFFDDTIVRRKKAAERYNELLQDDKRIVLPTYQRVFEQDSTVACVYAVYTISIEQRDEVMKRMKAAGVSCAVYYRVNCHKQPVFAEQLGAYKYSCPVSEKLSDHVLSLPMHAYLTEDVQVRVVKELKMALDDLNVQVAPS